MIIKSNNNIVYDKLKVNFIILHALKACKIIKLTFNPVPKHN